MTGHASEDYTVLRTGAPTIAMGSTVCSWLIERPEQIMRRTDN